MYKIAHISDSHISFNDENQRGKKLVELLEDIDARKCNHIILTGDIVDNPDRKDFLYVREIFSHFDLLDANKMSVVPGNHDIFGGAEKGNNFFRFVNQCSETDYDGNVERFIETFQETFPSNHSFPYLKIIDNIAIIGVNCIDRWSIDRNPEGSNGRILSEDYLKLKRIFMKDEIKDKYKLVLIHNHFNRPEFNEEYPAHSMWLQAINRKMKLYGKKKLFRLFKKNKVNLILHGHTHINEIHNIKKLTFLNSSACVFPITDDQVRKYNIISIPEAGDERQSITIDTITL